MFRSKLRLTALASLLATAPPAAATDIAIVNQTTLAVPLGTNGDSSGTGGVSDDGRYALLFSEASNLVPGDTNRATDLFLYDHQNDAVERVNLGNGGVQANADTLLKADLSDDARYAVFESRATNLVTADTHRTWQVYLRDRVAQTTTLVSRGLDGSGSETGGYAPQISADGRYVVFISYDALVESDINFFNDVYRYDRVSGTLEIISVSATGEAGNLDSSEARISADGHYVAFHTNASNLFPGDSNFAGDIVLRDTVANINVNATVSPSGGQFGGQRFFATGNAVSADGRYVLFNTDRALELVDSNAATDGFRFDRVTGQTTRVTHGPGGALLQYGATGLALSADGTVLLMESSGDDLLSGTTQGYRRSYARDLTSGSITLVKLRPGSLRPEDETTKCDLSGNGGIAYCTSYGRNLTDVDNNMFGDFFRSAIGADSGTRVSVPLPGSSAAANADSGDLSAGASDDGRYVAFQSNANNLVVGDNNGVSDVFLRDRLAGTTLRISRTASGSEVGCPSGEPRMTPDGRHVVFLSCGALLEPMAGATTQVYRYDRVTDHLGLVSTNHDGLPCNANCIDASISADGSVVAFASTATNLGQSPPPGGGVFARRLPGGAAILVNRPIGGGIADGVARRPQISGNGRFVMFSATSTNLVAGDTNGVEDVFAFDHDTATLQRVSLGPDGQELENLSRFADVSNDGSRILFWHVSVLCGSGFSALLVRDTASGQVDCVSEDGAAHIAYEPRGSAALSADGNRVAFMTPLTPPPYVTAPVESLVVHDRTTRRVHRVTPPEMNRDAKLLDLCAGGDCLLFSSSASNLVPNDPNNHVIDVFIAQQLTDDAIFDDGFETP